MSHVRGIPEPTLVSSIFNNYIISSKCLSYTQRNREKIIQTLKYKFASPSQFDERTGSRFILICYSCTLLGSVGLLTLLTIYDGLIYNKLNTTRTLIGPLMIYWRTDA